MANVFIDWWGLKPQYDVNEEVLCRIGHKWVAASVAYYWPIHEITRLPTRFQDEMHFYKCVVKDQEGVDRYHVVCLHDDERCIMEYPKSFRFKRGDKVVFATANAEEIPEQLKRNPWMAGTVTRTLVLDAEEYYAAYECIFNKNGTTFACKILKDDDEHLASIHASERDRLMDAIDQNCSLNHIEFLTNTAGGMDVSVFQDAVLKRAIAAGSYNTLLWLQKTFMLQLDEIQDAKGNTLLHQLAMSPNVIRFLETVSSTHHVKDLGYYAYVHIDLSDSHAGPSRPGMIHRKNESGETWLDVLIRQGNVAALDFALNQTKGVVWLIPDRKTFERADAA